MAGKTERRLSFIYKLISLIVFPTSRQIDTLPGKCVVIFAERNDMAEKSWYIDWFNSPFYHKLYFERDEEEAKAFICSLVDHLHPEAGSRMLDVACGRGRHSKMLASLGFEVTGFDISPDSIA